jgi:hypothetical protein
MRSRRAARGIAPPLNCGVRRHVKLIDLLGRHLKDDDVIRLLEGGDMQVVYQFDRLHENSPDYYDSEDFSRGFALRFNEDQILHTVFCYAIRTDPFEPIEPDIVGVPFYESIAAAETAARGFGAKFVRKDGVQGLGRVVSWLRLERDDRLWHFQYSNNELTLVTLMLNDQSAVVRVA